MEWLLFYLSGGGIFERKYNLVINNKQNMNLDELETNLINISKKYRDGVYVKGEYLDGLNDYGCCCFIYAKKRFLIDAQNELTKRGISCYLLTKKEYDIYIEEWVNKSNKQKQKIIDNVLFSLNSTSNKNDEQKLKVNKKNKNLSLSKKLSLSLEKMNLFDNFFNNKIIGQNEILEQIKQQLIHLTYNLENNSRPAGIFFFVGPTGVGKTEVCKQLSEFLYSNDKINRFDMSEYKSDVAIEKLIGAPNGYVGYEEGGVLINSMINNPNSVVLFDEIEKADKTVFDLFLQILDEGIVTSNKGQKISFKNNLIIFTSNIGANLISDHMGIKDIRKLILNEVDNFFNNDLNRPEILGRIGRDNILVFNLIDKIGDLYKILDIYFNKFISNLSNKNILISFDKPSVYNEILKNLDITKGARDIRNQFDVFQKKFMMSLYDKKLNFDDVKNKKYILNIKII